MGMLYDIHTDKLVIDKYVYQAIMNSLKPKLKERLHAKDAEYLSEEFTSTKKSEVEQRDLQTFIKEMQEQSDELKSKQNERPESSRQE